MAAVVVDTSRSRYARLRPVPLGAVKLSDAFWAPRLRVNREISLPAQHRLLEETGRLDNFRRAAGRLAGTHQGRVFNDSDVYKWLEAAAWALAGNEDPELLGLVDRGIGEVAAAQRPDGYLNTYFAGEREAERWTDVDRHEMYCAGHLIQAAVAHHRVTGRTNLLRVATRFASHICQTFGPAESKRRVWADGHPEVEMALVELFRLTGDQRYMAQAKFFVDLRGQGRLGSPYGGLYEPEYHQDHVPLRRRSRAEGHAVRDLYLDSGATDIYAETGEAALKRALERMWVHLTEQQLYVTGGAGSRFESEGFGADYELPNRAYAETCAAVAGVMWNWRMLGLQADARYADLMEVILYNGFLAGVSLDGKAYFYVNPLADDGSHRRQPWFDCACCPPNVARLLASLPSYIYSVSDAECWVHLYAEGSADLQLPDGRLVRLVQRTAYPADGSVAVEVRSEGHFALRLRVPGWCQDASVQINGRPRGAEVTPGAYLRISRRWSAGDQVQLSLAMPVRRIASHPHVIENAGRVALTRGPLVYCVEQADNPGIDPRDIVLTGRSAFSVDRAPRGLDGVVALTGKAGVVKPGAGWSGRLYETVGERRSEAPARTATVVAVPYFAWGNRQPGRMQVWLRAQA